MSDYSPIEITQGWKSGHRVLFHAICAQFMDVLLIADPEDSGALSYLLAVQRLLDCLDTPHICLQDNEMLSLSIDQTDDVLSDYYDVLQEDFKDYLSGERQLSESAQIFQAINSAVKFIAPLEDSIVEQLLRSIEYSPELLRYASDAISHTKKLIIEMADSVFKIYGASDVVPEKRQTINHEPLIEVYNRVQGRFDNVAGEPTSVVSILKSKIPDYYPDDAEAYYQRKIREIFKMLENNREIVSDDDCWCFIWILRGWLYRAVTMHGDGEYDHAVSIVLNLTVECCNGLSKGVMRQKWDNDSMFSEVVKSLLDDALCLLLLFMEQQDDSYIDKVHRRIKRMESALRKSAFWPTDLDRLNDYIYLRLM